MRKPHISITRTHATKATLASFASLAAFSVAVATSLCGCEGNNKPPMTPDGPEMDLDASAPPVVTPASPKGTTGAAPSAAPPSRPNPG